MRTATRTGIIAVLVAASVALAGCSGTPPKDTAASDETFTYANNLVVMTSSRDPASRSLPTRSSR